MSDLIFFSIWVTGVIASYYSNRYLQKFLFKKWDWSDIYRMFIISSCISWIGVLLALLIYFDNSDKDSRKPPKWL